MCDSLLIVEGETRRRFRFSIAFEQPYPLQAALDAMNLFTFYGGIKFDTSEEAHGLQIGHSMVVIQWQKNDAGELVREVVWPADVATKDPIFPVPAP